MPRENRKAQPQDVQPESVKKSSGNVEAPETPMKVTGEEISFPCDFKLILTYFGSEMADEAIDFGIRIRFIEIH